MIQTAKPDQQALQSAFRERLAGVQQLLEDGLALDPEVLRTLTPSALIKPFRTEAANDWFSGPTALGQAIMRNPGAGIGDVDARVELLLIQAQNVIDLSLELDARQNHTAPRVAPLVSELDFKWRQLKGMLFAVVLDFKSDGTLTEAILRLDQRDIRVMIDALKEGDHVLQRFYDVTTTRWNTAQADAYGVDELEQQLTTHLTAVFLTIATRHDEERIT
jgi:hypothetical protein